VDIIAYAKIGSVWGFISAAEVSKNKGVIGVYVWGIIGMWTVTLAAIIVIFIRGKNVDVQILGMVFSLKIWNQTWVSDIYINALAFWLEFFLLGWPLFC